MRVGRGEGERGGGGERERGEGEREGGEGEREGGEGERGGGGRERGVLNVHYPPPIHLNIKAFLAGKKKKRS